jgi:hypothetical protein
VKPKLLQLHRDPGVGKALEEVEEHIVRVGELRGVYAAPPVVPAFLGGVRQHLVRLGDAAELGGVWVGFLLGLEARARRL